MLSTRLWMGSVLIALVVGMLVVDQTTPGRPFQLAFQLLLAVLSLREIKRLLGPDRSVFFLLTICGTLALNLAPWWIAVESVDYDVRAFIPDGATFTRATEQSNILLVAAIRLAIVLLTATALHLAIFLAEMRTFEQPGASFERMARTWWVIAYLGLLPSFFAQIRWLYPWASPLGTSALALAIFVPKGCDIGAYFTGRLLGKHPMTPVLSPKKTWEGAIGGLAFAVLVAIGIDRLGPTPVLNESWPIEIGFGLSVGLAGMLGDLAESLIKRDCQQKDASQVVPGFGGVLDVIDAVIFAAPVAFAWFLILLLV